MAAKLGIGSMQNYLSKVGFAVLMEVIIETSVFLDDSVK
jgi:hypothetical protein